MHELAPYDRIAAQWANARQQGTFRERPYVDRFLACLQAGGSVLDLGCGSGLPIARYVLDRDCRGIGLDASPAMLRLARAACPEAALVRGDLSAIPLSRPFDGVIPWDSLFHLTKSQQTTVFGRLAEGGKPEAPLLLSLGGSDGEFTATMFETEFFFSGHGPDVSLALLRQAGFEIVVSEIEDPSSRGHLAVLCRKRRDRPYDGVSGGSVEEKPFPVEIRTGPSTR